MQEYWIFIDIIGNSGYGDVEKATKEITILSHYVEWRNNPLFKKTSFISVKDENISKKIIEEFEKNNTVVFDTIKPLLKRNDLIDIIIDNKISFQSIEESDFSKSVSEMLLYLANKKGIRPAGNVNAGLNTKIPADKFAKKIGPILDEMHLNGHETFRAKADQLNEKNIKTIRGKNWTGAHVHHLLNRWEKLRPDKE